MKRCKSLAFLLRTLDPPLHGDFEGFLERTIVGMRRRRRIAAQDSLGIVFVEFAGDARLDPDGERGRPPLPFQAPAPDFVENRPGAFPETSQRARLRFPGV